MTPVPDEPTPVEIHTDTIKLDSFLKWAGIVETGGHAKQLVEIGAVAVNGQQEQRRGHQLHVGDIVTVKGFGVFEVTREQEV